MPTKTDVVREQLEELRQDIRDLTNAIVRDPKKEARKERMWLALTGVTGAVATLLARRVTARVWGILTGERPPTKR
jgi:hypothetical protein